MFWIINDNIKFVPENKSLVSLVNSELKTTLTTPASSCFSILLEASPDVVTQKELFEKVWSDEAMFVTNNTLYQNISLIRRGLRTVGLADDTLIVTIPRKGFKISERTRIAKVMDDTAPLPQWVDAVRTVTSEESDGSVPALDQAEPVFGHKKLKLLEMLKTLFVLICLFSFGFWGTNAFYSLQENNNFFKNYKLFETENHCQFYSKIDDVYGREMFYKFKRLIIKTNLDCKTYPWVYFSSSGALPVLSAIACKHENFTGCVTLYFREAGHE